MWFWTRCCFIIQVFLRRKLLFSLSTSAIHIGVVSLSSSMYGCQIEYYPDGSIIGKVPSRCLMPTFFWYCSLHPSGGDCELSNKHGIIWFLNLANSHNQHRKCVDEMGDNAPLLTFVKPFGKKFLSTGNMVGSKYFPALRVSDENSIPLQIDQHSCGIGMVAGIAISFSASYLVGVVDGGNTIFQWHDSHHPHHCG